MPNNLKISLAAARVNADLTQEEAAQLMKISKSTLVSWEKHKTFPSVSQAEKLYALYNRPKDSIIF
ncbi:MAG: helix-turn-helix transcriptional regulator [Lachnospiraceae bacterium]|nr:helix-turn-helix transcriptional regulator [Lachnospiraceae bacterium]